MYKTHARTKHRSNHHRSDLTDDLTMIKDAIARAGRGVKWKTGEWVTSSIDDVKEKSTELHDGMTHYVAKKPMKSLGLAMLAGALVGYFLHK